MRPIAQKMKKPWVVMPLAALLAVGGWTAVKGDDEPSAAQATATTQVVEATSGTMAKTVSADGTVTAAETDELSFGSSGTVTAVNVEAGDTVAAGDVLAEIDSAELQAAVSEAESSLAQAEATLADDEDSGASDEQISADESSITSATDQLASAEEALEGAQLIATFDGTVATVNISVGEELASGGTGGTTATGSGSGSGGSSSTLGSSTSSASPDGSTGSDSSSTSSADITVTSTGRYTVDLGLDATDIESVEVGQLATVSLSTSSSSTTTQQGPGGMGGFNPMGQTTTDTATDDAADEDTTSTTEAAATPSEDAADGLVTEVETVADASSGVATYPVTVAFTSDDGTYNAGASVTVEITYASVDDAVQVPSMAVTTGTDGTSTVTVQTDDGTEERTVEIGLTDGSMVQITSGLEAGESVVITAPTGGPGGSTDTGSAPQGVPTGAATDAGTDASTEGAGS